jgi:hypothetical protein
VPPDNLADKCASADVRMFDTNQRDIWLRRGSGRFGRGVWFRYARDAGVFGRRVLHCAPSGHAMHHQMVTAGS